MILVQRKTKKGFMIASQIIFFTSVIDCTNPLSTQNNWTGKNMLIQEKLLAKLLIVPLKNNKNSKILIEEVSSEEECYKKSEKWFSGYDIHKSGKQII